MRYHVCGVLLNFMTIFVSHYLARQIVDKNHKLNQYYDKNIRKKGKKRKERKKNRQNICGERNKACLIFVMIQPKHNSKNSQRNKHSDRH